MQTANMPHQVRRPPGSSNDVQALLASASLLQRAEPGSELHGLLRGKNLGLVCDAEADEDAVRFRTAAEALGATVSHVRPSLAEPGSPGAAALRHTARVLGRLYDGIECQGGSPAFMQHLRDDAGVPVFEGLARSDHPTAHLALLLDGADAPERKRQLILQAALLFALR